MTKRLRAAIKNVIATHTIVDENILNFNILELRQAYEEHQESITVTMQRVEYLESCLLNGMNKRQAAKALVEHDPRIGRRTAETLVYTSFSGMYQNPRKRRRSSSEMSTVIEQVEPPSISADEDLL